MNLSKMDNFVSEVTKSPALRREILLCMVALSDKKIFNGDALEINGKVYVRGIKGLYTPEGSLVSYDTFGFKYLENYANKVKDRDYDLLSVHEIIRDEYSSLFEKHRQSCAPKDLEDAPRNADRDEYIKQLEKENKEALTNIELLSKTLVEQVKENKKLKSKLKVK